MYMCAHTLSLQCMIMYRFFIDTYSVYIMCTYIYTNTHTIRVYIYVYIHINILNMYICVTPINYVCIYIILHVHIIMYV